MKKLILAIFYSVLCSACVSTTQNEFPVTLYVIDYQMYPIRDSVDKAIVENSTKYLDRIIIHKDGKYEYSENTFSSYGNRNYKEAVAVDVYKGIELEKGCPYTSLHKSKPNNIKEGEYIEPYTYLEFDGKMFDGWRKFNKAYFPSKEFFRCLYKKGYYIDEKIGKMYDDNNWEQERVPFELLSAIIDIPERTVISIAENKAVKYILFPHGLKKYYKENLKKFKNQE